MEAKRRQAFVNLRLPLTYINYGNYYGFSMDEINNYLEHGRNATIIINDPGVIRDLKNIYKGQCISCYVHRTIPKNKEIFMEIAKQRGDTQESAEIRYRKALKDWDIYTNNTELYDYTILNTDNGVQRLSKMIEDLNTKDFRHKQNEMQEKQEKPKVYVFSGNPGSGKDEALETIRIQGILHSIILPKHTTRHREKSDGEEMICPEDEEFDIESCDLQYNNFGATYGINTEEIKERLEDGISSSIVVSNKEALEKLKRKFPESIVNIYIQGLSKEEYMIQQKEHLGEDYVKKRVQEYEKADELYYNQWLDFNHVIINNGDLSDLKRQIDSIQRYYEGGRDLSGKKVRDYMEKANKEKNAGMWDISVAGHISTGQDALSAAAREINEEVSVSLGYNVDIKSFRYMFSYRTQQKYSKDFIENQFYDFFILRKEGLNIEDVKMQETEVQAIKFVSINELLKMQEEKKIVERKPVYNELINYLHRY